MEDSTGNVSLADIPALAGLIANTEVIEHAPGENLFECGDTCTTLPVITSGTARIFACGNASRQVTLYRLQAGDLCPISLSTLLSDCLYPAAATAETRVQVRYLEGARFVEIIRQSPELFNIFLKSFAGCLYNSVCTAHRLMFDPLDVRLASLLDEQFTHNPDRSINFTHDEIAKELGTTRVVASRLLKKLEHADCIRLSRKKIMLTDATALKKLIKDDARISGIT